jgi:hypothetical protein
MDASMLVIAGQWCFSARAIDKDRARMLLDQFKAWIYGATSC